MKADDPPVLRFETKSVRDDGFLFERTFQLGAAQITVRLASHRFELIVESTPPAESKVA